MTAVTTLTMGCFAGRARFPRGQFQVISGGRGGGAFLSVKSSVLVVLGGDELSELLRGSRVDRPPHDENLGD